MSLFENSEYQWRETYFIHFDEQNRPSAEAVTKALKEIDSRYEIQNARANDAGQLESLTLISPDDYAAMDITFVDGEDVQEQMPQLIKELMELAAPDEIEKIRKIEAFNCRFDIYHFEQLIFVGKTDANDEDDFMDPGALLIVMQELAEVCQGIVVDPQGNTVL